MDFSKIKSLLIKGKKVKDLSVNGKKVWAVEQQQIIDLTNTSWNIPAGWTATAGYGIYSINYSDERGVYDKLAIGYYGGDLYDYVGDSENKLVTFVGDIDEFGGRVTGVGYEVSSTATLNITITGGTDVTNTDLINWLQANGKQLISFTIGDTTYQAEEGMTWGEWVDSEYNTGGYVVNSYGYIILNGESSVDSVLDRNDIMPVYSNEIIIPNNAYGYGSHMGGSED